MEQIEAIITCYLSAMDMADQEDAATVPNKPGKLKEKIAALRTRMEQLKARHPRLAIRRTGNTTLARLERGRNDRNPLDHRSRGPGASRAGQTDLSLTDPDARSMATSGKGTGVVGYNVQVAVDTKHHLIVAHEVTNVGNDRGQLATMAKQAQAAMGRQELEVLADRGYYKGEEILACRTAGMMPFVPKPLTSGSKSEGRFGKQDFVYVADDDT